jgi:exodeoxyribonuclease-3
MFMTLPTTAGYSGVATYVRKGLTRSVHTNVFGNPEYDGEGRVIQSDHGSFVLFNVYFPNSRRIEYKMGFHGQFSSIVQRLLDEGRHVIVAGDVNIAHRPIDIYDPVVRW